MMAGKEKKAKQAIALSEIFIIVCATVAFAFILGSSQSVSAADVIAYSVDGKLYSYMPPGGYEEVYVNSKGWIYNEPETVPTRVYLGAVNPGNVFDSSGQNIISGGFSQVNIVTTPQPASSASSATPVQSAASSAGSTGNGVTGDIAALDEANAAKATTISPAAKNLAARGALGEKQSAPSGVPVAGTATAVKTPSVDVVTNGVSKILSSSNSFNLNKADGSTTPIEGLKRYEVKDGKLYGYNAEGKVVAELTDKKEIDAFIAKAGSLGAASTGVSTVSAFYDTSGNVIKSTSTSFKNVVIDSKTYDGILIDNNKDVWVLDPKTNKYTKDNAPSIEQIKANRDLVSAVPADTNVEILKKLDWKVESNYKATIDGKAYDGTLYRDPNDASKSIFVDSKGNQKKLESNLKDGKEVWKDVSASKEDLSKIAGKTAGGHLTEALVWAGGFAALVQIIGATGIIEKNTANAITVAGVAGIVVWKGLVALDAVRGKGPTWVSKYGGLIGIGVAAVVFWLMYKKSEKRIVSLECLPFEPPIGGKNCEKCNANPFSPCSEYRCKALGQACTLLNPGTGKELCAWESKFDVKSATIQPLKSVLNPNDLKYIEDTSLRPNAKGVKIVRGSNGCLQAFTPLVFGITTNKPTQCKVDYSHTSSYGDMQYLFGGENYYSYNHTQRMKLPTPEGSANDTETPELKNDGTYSLYVRCQDVNGNQNVDEYSVSFCVDASEDTTPPMIEKASIISGSPVRYMVDSVPIEIYVNEPADCKWSRTDKPYEDMENGMSCASDASQINNDLLYTCSGNLTGVKDKEDNKFFFRCKDNPGKEENRRNVMVQSWPSTSGFILKGSRPLIITNVAPNGTLFGSTTTVNVNLQVETSSGAEEGKAICMFSPSGVNGTYLNMYETENYISKQSLDLTSGNYRYYFRCNDAGGNSVENSTAFSVQVDKSSPLITRVYKEVPDALKIITSEDAECAYSLTSCNFEFNDGIKMIYSNPSIKNVHFAEWKPSSVYYLRCRDFYNNEPSSGACNLIVSAVKLTSERVDA